MTPQASEPQPAPPNTCRRYVGRSVLITGGAAGIGRATAERIAAEGGNVFITDRNSQALTETENELVKGGALVASSVMDVSSEDDWRRCLLEFRHAFATLDVLVNNAGFSHVGMITEYRAEDWRTLHDTQLFGMFLGMKHSIPLLREAGRGAIVNVASTMGMMGFPRIPAYSAAKGGVIALSRQVALDFAPDNIRVNCVCPGPTRTERLRGIVDSGDSLSLGIGAMTDERMKGFFDEMVRARVVKPDLDYRRAYTLQFVNKKVGLDLRPK